MRIMSTPDRPLVSVVTVTLNAEHSLGETLRSVATQDYPAIEHIIIDGASTDRTQDVVRQHGRRVSCFVSEPDKCVYEAMNKGLRRAAAASELITFLNAGDTFSDPSTVGRVVADAKHLPGCHVYGDITRSGRRVAAPTTFNLWFLATNMLCHQAVFFRTVQHRRFPYDESYPLCADYKLFADMLRARERFARIQVVIADYAPGGLSATRRQELHAEKRRIRRQHPKLRLLHILKRALRKPRRASVLKGKGARGVSVSQRQG